MNDLINEAKKKITIAMDTEWKQKAHKNIIESFSSRKRKRTL